MDRFFSNVNPHALAALSFSHRASEPSTSSRSIHLRAWSKHDQRVVSVTSARMQYVESIFNKEVETVEISNAVVKNSRRLLSFLFTHIDR